MLTYEDNATIRNAILRRLDKEPGVAIADIKIERHSDCIAVGVWAIIEDTSSHHFIPDVRSFFDLPLSFEHSHLLDEIDEIAELIKEARRQIGPFALFSKEIDGKRFSLNGTGRRGRWDRYA